MRGPWDRSRNTFFFRQYVLKLSAVLSTFLSSIYTFTSISFFSLVVGWGSYRGIYSYGSLGDSMSLVKLLFLTRSFSSIKCGNSKSVAPYNTNSGEVLGYLQEVWVTLTAKMDVRLEVTTTSNVLRQSDKTKQFTHCRFLLKQAFWSFLSFIILEYIMNYQNLPPCPDT
jgi:hypothetical protein